MDQSRLIFIHGSGGDKSQTYKARLLRVLFPGMLIPDFDGDLPERMDQLKSILGKESGWTLIGSSLGGLMAALFTLQAPNQVRKLMLLAPALTFPEFEKAKFTPIQVPTTIIHGTRDELLQLETVREIARNAFVNLKFIVVDDDHRLHETAGSLDWQSLLT
jgi:pimeloyl-ACP methyl ester carboxylesterase